MVTSPSVSFPVQLQLSETPRVIINSTVGNPNETSSRLFAYPFSSNQSTASTSDNGGGRIFNDAGRNSQTKMDFWRLPDGNSHFRPMKRPSGLATNDSEGVVTGPQPKLRITEEKMLARLRNFHITSASNDMNRGWFFMQRPLEMFDDIENRMSDDDEDDEEIDENLKNGAKSKLDTDELSEKRRILAMSDYLKRMLKDDCKRAASLSDASCKDVTTMPLPQPSINPCTDIVLWKPPGDFIKEIVSNVAEPETIVSPSNDGLVWCQSSEFVSDTDMTNADAHSQRPEYSSSLMCNASDRFMDSIPYQRRNARQYSKPIIEILRLSTSCNEHNVDATGNRSIDHSWMMDVDEKNNP